MKRAWIIAALSAVLSWDSVAGTVSQNQAVNALLGEAVGTPAAMPAIASVIRARGSLRGIYGVNNPCVRRASAHSRAVALAAWQGSATNDASRGCHYFGCGTDSAYFIRIGLHEKFSIGTGKNAIYFWDK